VALRFAPLCHKKRPLCAREPRARALPTTIKPTHSEKAEAKRAERESIRRISLFLGFIGPECLSSPRHYMECSLGHKNAFNCLKNVTHLIAEIQTALAGHFLSPNACVGAETSCGADGELVF
jgi:hypothetical protein